MPPTTKAGPQGRLWAGGGVGASRKKKLGPPRSSLPSWVTCGRCRYRLPAYIGWCRYRLPACLHCCTLSISVSVPPPRGWSDRAGLFVCDRDNSRSCGLVWQNSPGLEIGQCPLWLVNRLTLKNDLDYFPETTVTSINKAISPVMYWGKRTRCCVAYRHGLASFGLWSLYCGHKYA